VFACIVEYVCLHVSIREMVYHFIGILLVMQFWNPRVAAARDLTY
jgi:hypothetical protein